MAVRRRIHYYFLTAVMSLLIAVVGFSYNLWRLEVSETNSTIRTASFQMFVELAQLEQLIFALHYDQSEANGNPRDGWVKVGLISDLSALAGDQVVSDADFLKASWQENWQQIGQSQSSVDSLTKAIDRLRSTLRSRVEGLN